MYMDDASVLLYCPKPCSKLSFSCFLPSTVSYWNLYRLLLYYYNPNAHNLAFCIFSISLAKPHSGGSI